MTAHSPQAVGRALERRCLSPPFGPEQIRTWVREVGDELLTRSQAIEEPNFTAIAASDLELLFNAYDRRFLAGLCRKSLGQDRLTFRLSSRMTRSGGTTSRRRLPGGRSDFEITVGTSILFDGFGEGDPDVTVAGLPCGNRLAALQRIFEHELVHLIEFLCFRRSSCAAARFQKIARGLFLHRSHTHELITRAERAARVGIVPGARVAFSYRGRRLTGRVNRITKRATVLVEDPGGVMYSDGCRYRKYYVPLGALELLPSSRDGR